MIALGCAPPFESRATCTPQDRALEQAIKARLVRGSVSLYSMQNPPAFGLVFSYGPQHHTVEQEYPFDADEIVAKAEDWADTMENARLPRGWGRTL
jgi:hypothetical protein